MGESRRTILYEGYVRLESGGGGLHLTGLSIALAEGADVHVVAPVAVGPDGVASLGIPTHPSLTYSLVRVPGSMPYLALLLFEIRKVLITLVWAIRNRRADRHLLSRLAGFSLSPFLALATRSKYVVEINGWPADEATDRGLPSPVSSVLDKFVDLQLRFATGIVAVTAGLAERSGYDGPTLVLPNGVRRELLESVPDVEPDFDLVYGGALTSWYDFQLVAEALELRPGVRLLLFGDGPTQSEVHALFADAIKRGQVSIGPRLAHAEAAARMRQATVGLVPLRPKAGRSSGSPLKLYEYLSLGLNVVAARMDGIDESDAIDFYEVGSAASMVQAIDRALARPRPTDEAIATVLAQHSWSARATTLACFLDDL